MALTSLLVCADAQTVQALTRILSDMDVSVEHCGDPALALSRLAVQKFDSVLVECKQDESAGIFISDLRRVLMNRDVAIIAILEDRNNVREVFARGANFVLYKPVSTERVISSMAAAHSLAPNDKRTTQRISVSTKAVITYSTVENQAAEVFDLSEEGIAIRSEGRLPANCKIYFQFSLPGKDSVIRLSGQVIWQDESGHVGLRFVDVPTASRRVLNEWIKTKATGRLSVTQSFAPSETPAKVTKWFPQDFATRVGLVSASGAERRKQSRYQCSIGAEVSREGSTIHQRCVLTDISAGGCYVQTMEPFAVGTPIEIVVRTHELKLKMLGKVQSTHHGLGMGIHLTLGPQEQVQVQQLMLSQQREPQVPS